MGTPAQPDIMKSACLEAKEQRLANSEREKTDLAGPAAQAGSPRITRAGSRWVRAKLTTRVAARPMNSRSLVRLAPSTRAAIYCGDRKGGNKKGEGVKTERWCTTVGPAKGGVSGQMPDHRQTRHSDSAPPSPLPPASCHCR